MPQFNKIFKHLIIIIINIINFIISSLEKKLFNIRYL
jgi:hypothetical protein